MSVAVRRDSDEEHLEPKFEVPLPPGPNLVTRRGLAIIAERLAALRAQLDLAADEAARAPILRDLRYWEARESSAQLAPAASGERVEFGTHVSVRLNGKPRTFQIVGDDEADPAAGLLSFNAPLSRAMMGGEEGDWLPFGGAEDAIEILAISVVSSPTA
jgi:transcription elongation GreA/GreB family factor